MPFTGKATYDGGASLPELVDDVSDLVGLISPFDTPLLDAIGSPRYSAKSTHHEWFEDKLNPNFSLINNGAGYNATATSWVVASGPAHTKPTGRTAYQPSGQSRRETGSAERLTRAPTRR